MRHRRQYALAAIMLAAASHAIIGCRALAFPFLMWGEAPTKEVSAEYPHLAGRQVLVMVRAEADTLFDYPHVQYELARYVQAAIEPNVSGVGFVPAKPVAEMQQQEPSWDKTPPAAHARRFRADRVLRIELTRYGTREPESPHLFRGHIHATVSIYDPAYGDNVDAVYRTTIESVFPEGGPGSYGVNDREVRRAVMEQFATQLARKFYDHEIEA